MKTLWINFLLSLLPFTAYSQGTFVYDQQSALENPGEGSFVSIQGNEPLGQSFTPTFSSVGFIRLFLLDGNDGNGLGSTIYLNLRSTSISGTTLSSTEPVLLTDSSRGYINFFFPVPVAVTPATTYFFDVNVQSGDSWQIRSFTGYNYSGGMAFFDGNAALTQDLWFREGIVAVPEPSPVWLALLGGGVLLFIRSYKSRYHCSRR